MRLIGISVAAGLAVFALAACGGGGGGDESPSPDATMGNPASEYCAQQGGTVDLATGICTLPDGTQVDEWELYRSANPS